MQNKWWAGVGAVVALCIAGAVAVAFWAPHSRTPAPTTAPTAPPSTPDLIQEQVDRLTLPEKVAQLLIVGHWGGNASTTAARLQRYQFGGVILMDPPANASTTIAAWTQRWQREAATPLLIGIDQEGGVVNRLDAPGFVATGQPAINSTAAAHHLGHVRGAELQQLGINTTFAPVLDSARSSTSFLYQRAFQPPERIATYGSALIAGLAKANVLAVPKHFPGHADTPADSHTELPVVDLSSTTFAAHTSPFAEVLRTAKPGALMTAHVLVPSIDTVYPATLSHTILTTQLRGHLGYQGVLITDDMTMAAISNTWGMDDATVRALEAGADMALFAAKPEEAATALAAVVTAVERGTLPMARIDEAVYRVLSLKAAQGW